MDKFRIQTNLQQIASQINQYDKIIKDLGNANTQDFQTQNSLLMNILDKVQELQSSSLAKIAVCLTSLTQQVSILTNKIRQEEDLKTFTQHKWNMISSSLQDLQEECQKCLNQGSHQVFSNYKKIQSDTYQRYNVRNKILEIKNQLYENEQDINEIIEANLKLQADTIELDKKRNNLIQQKQKKLELTSRMMQDNPNIEKALQELRLEKEKVQGQLEDLEIEIIEEPEPKIQNQVSSKVKQMRKDGNFHISILIEQSEQIYDETKVKELSTGNYYFCPTKVSENKVVLTSMLQDFFQVQKVNQNDMISLYYFNQERVMQKQTQFKIDEDEIRLANARSKYCNLVPPFSDAFKIIEKCPEYINILVLIIYDEIELQFEQAYKILQKEKAKNKDLIVLGLNMSDPYKQQIDIQLKQLNNIIQPKSLENESQFFLLKKKENTNPLIEIFKVLNSKRKQSDDWETVTKQEIDEEPQDKAYYVEKLQTHERKISEAKHQIEELDAIIKAKEEEIKGFQDYIQEYQLAAEKLEESIKEVQYHIDGNYQKLDQKKQKLMKLQEKTRNLQELLEQEQLVQQDIEKVKKVFINLQEDPIHEIMNSIKLILEKSIAFQTNLLKLYESAQHQSQNQQETITADKESLDGATKFLQDQGYFFKQTAENLDSFVQFNICDLFF